jgi:hypothetical protein
MRRLHVIRILEKVGQYYEENGISAQKFECPNYRDCRGGCAAFTKSREPFVGSKYDKGGKRKQPRILFVSLDSGAGRRFARERTAENARHWAEHVWEYKGSDRNKHWFQTHRLAWTILRAFDIESEGIRERIDSYFAHSKVASDSAISSAVRKHVTPYFAHTNSAKCSQNKNGKAQAHSRLFKNCRDYLAGELAVLAPDIIVTQGAQAKNAVDHALVEGSIVREVAARATSKSYAYKILEIAGRQVLWFHTYHPKNYGKFHAQQKECWERWATIAVTRCKKRAE